MLLKSFLLALALTGSFAAFAVGVYDAWNSVSPLAALGLVSIALFVNVWYIAYKDMRDDR